MTSAEAAKWISERDGFLVVTHRRPDGDTLGCASALVVGMRRAGKTAYIMRNREVTERYAAYMGQYFEPDGYVPEHIVAVDLASPGLFPKGSEEALDGKVELCIDHHPSNTFYAAETCIDIECAACGELMYDVLMALNGSISEEEAKLLYIAVSTDTGCFAYGNTTSRTFECAARLADAGAPIGELNKELFRTKSKKRVALESRIYSAVEYFCDSRAAVVAVTRQMLDECGVDENDLEDIAALPGIIEGIEVSMVLRETPDGMVKASVRSGPDFNCNEVCSRFGGGGHAMASGCTFETDIDEAKRAIMAAVSELLK